MSYYFPVSKHVLVEKYNYVDYAHLFNGMLFLSIFLILFCNLSVTSKTADYVCLGCQVQMVVFVFLGHIVD